MEKNVLVIGGNGLLGTAFRKVAGEKYTYSVRRFGDAKFSSDIVIEDISKLSPGLDGDLLKGFDVIINCAAVTDVDKIENDYNVGETAWNTNVTGVKKLAEMCRQNGTTLIHISSDYVFDGTIGREYFPSDTIHPINKYGEQKAAAEHVIMNSGCKYIIIRTSWLYSPYTPCFVTKFIDLALNKGSAVLTNNIISSPTSATHLANAIKHIINTNCLDKIGIYHFTDEGCCTRYDMVQYIFRKLGVDRYPAPVSDSYWNSNVRRPFCSLMSKKSFTDAFDYFPRGWMECLNTCIDTYIEDKKES